VLCEHCLEHSVYIVSVLCLMIDAIPRQLRRVSKRTLTYLELSQDFKHLRQNASLLAISRPSRPVQTSRVERPPSMSRKHFFHNTEGVVVHMLSSLVTRNQHMALDTPNRVVYNLSHPPSQVTIISGGGSGHEPAWSGFVGDGMLSAAVCGDIFASPSTKQVMAGIRNVPSNEGIILCITNYTGDMLHFGLAREKGQAMGYKVDVVCMAEDASLGRAKSEKVGRRGLAGNLLVIKLIGAASQKCWAFERCRKIGELGNSQLVTIGTSLDHCHVPGREAFESVADDACVLGMGIHNEPVSIHLLPLYHYENHSTDVLRASVRSPLCPPQKK
jgi:dihydroxyacetone kinase